MAITIWPVKSDFVAEIGDVDLSRQLSVDDVSAIKQAFWDFGVVIFPDQDLSEEQHLAFARHFGELEQVVFLKMKVKLRLRPELADVSNLNRKSEIWREQSRLRMLAAANRLWHTDSSFKYLPARASLLYAREIPPVGGRTEFADLRAAYDALPDSRKAQIEGLVAEHSLIFSRERTGFTGFTDEERNNLRPVPQVLVRKLPENHRQTLYLASHIGRIRGMPDDQARRLVDELIAHATQAPFVHNHRWRKHDLVMWDDRWTMHRATPYDEPYPRKMRQAAVHETQPV